MLKRKEWEIINMITLIRKQFIAEEFGFKIKTATNLETNKICIHYSLFNRVDNKWVRSTTDNKCFYGSSLTQLIDTYNQAFSREEVIELYICEHFKELNPDIEIEDIDIQNLSNHVCKSCK